MSTQAMDRSTTNHVVRDSGTMLRRNLLHWLRYPSLAIMLGGENIYPAEVEAAIAELADVTAAAVVAVPDPTWGEVGCAYVVLRPGADLDETAMRAHLEQRLARYKIPRYVELRDELPRNATGKVLRSVLRDQARQDHAPQ